ncbi:MAG TPA: prepilin peptidase [Candidatus Saccharimonadales bacterium]|nr:prepilin peptidase [Candidatus Saccharimonadales bacterium]
MLLLAIYLFILGVCLGSFVNALTWRLEKGKDWVRGRSQCPHCGHQLAARDLVPLFSWLILRGRCRYCKQSISVQYPLVELAGGAVFCLSYIFWPANLDQAGNLILFITWLVASVGLLALALYDLKYMLLPSKILYPIFFIAAAGQLIYLIGFAPAKATYALGWLISVLIATGIFWLIFMVSKGRWIGYGDVRLGLVTGTLLHRPALAVLMIFLASLAGSVIAVPMLAIGKKTLSARIPYGPYLIAATFICLLFGPRLVDLYKQLLLP